MIVVIDASMAVKWFLLEPDSAAARAVLAENIGEICVPAIFGIEVVATLVREANNHKPHADSMRDAISRLTSLMSDGSITARSETPDQLANAANIAIDLGHPFKDCLYLALAIALECELVTCDAKFATKAKGIWTGVRLLGA
jgi:predicted nucleic acid-binding protein